MFFFIFDLNKLVRENIRKMIPYSSARDEFKGKADIFLDANENSLGSPLANNYNRYPDPLQWKIKYRLAEIKGVPPQNIVVWDREERLLKEAGFRTKNAGYRLMFGQR